MSSVIKQALARAGKGDLAGAVALLAPHEGQADAQLASVLGGLRLQMGDLDGALDVLVPAQGRAESGGHHGDAALVGLCMTQVFMALGQGLQALRVLVRTRRHAERAHKPALAKAAAALATTLAGRIEIGEGPVTAHFGGLLARARGDIPGSRKALERAWKAAEQGASLAVRAEIGLDLAQRKADDGDPSWKTVLAEAREAARKSGDIDLVELLDKVGPPETPEEEGEATDAVDAARRRANRGDVAGAVAALKARLVAGSTDRLDTLATRTLLGELHAAQGEADDAVHVLTPAWQALELDGDGAALAAFAPGYCRALAAVGRIQDALRVLLVADALVAPDAAQQEPLHTLGAELGAWLPAPDDQTPPESRALLLGAHALLARLHETPDADALLQRAWAAAHEAGDIAVAHVGLDVATLGRADGDARWEAARDEARAAAERCGDDALRVLLEALG